MTITTSSYILPTKLHSFVSRISLSLFFFLNFLSGEGSCCIFILHLNLYACIKYVQTKDIFKHVNFKDLPRICECIFYYITLLFYNFNVTFKNASKIVITHYENSMHAMTIITSTTVVASSSQNCTPLRHGSLRRVHVEGSC